MGQRTFVAREEGERIFKWAKHSQDGIKMWRRARTGMWKQRQAGPWLQPGQGLWENSALQRRIRSEFSAVTCSRGIRCTQSPEQHANSKMWTSQSVVDCVMANRVTAGTERMFHDLLLIDRNNFFLNISDTQAGTVENKTVWCWLG